MRNDEEYCSTEILKYLHTTNKSIQVLEGEDPPDYYIVDGNKRIPLEITNCNGVYSDSIQYKSRSLFVDPLIRLCNELNSRFFNIMPDLTILLSIEGPVYGFSKFKRVLIDFINKIIQNATYDIYQDDWTDVCINQDKIRVCITEHQNGKKKIVGCIGVKTSQTIFNVQKQAEIALGLVIEQKESKIKANNDGQKWLGIINNNPLLDRNNYQIALNNTQVDHGFTRIFVLINDCIAELELL